MEKEEAEAIVEQLILSLPSLLGESSFNEIVDNIKSPNGTTEAGINSLSENSFDKIMFDAIEAATNRSIEISKENNNGK
jgi:pyrroline-5-carboxylate reductase